jgi:hypothetical protein
MEKMMIKSKVIDWLITNDEKGRAKDMHDFAHGSEHVTTRIVKLVVGNEMFEAMSYDVPVYIFSNETIISESISVAEPKLYTREEVLDILHQRMTYTLGLEYNRETTVKWFEQNIQ